MLLRYLLPTLMTAYGEEEGANESGGNLRCRIDRRVQQSCITKP